MPKRRPSSPVLQGICLPVVSQQAKPLRWAKGHLQVSQRVKGLRPVNQRAKARRCQRVKVNPASQPANPNLRASLQRLSKQPRRNYSKRPSSSPKRSKQRAKERRRFRDKRKSPTPNFARRSKQLRDSVKRCLLFPLAKVLQPVCRWAKGLLLAKVRRWVKQVSLQAKELQLARVLPPVKVHPLVNLLLQVKLQPVKELPWGRANLQVSLPDNHNRAKANQVVRVSLVRVNLVKARASRD